MNNARTRVCRINIACVSVLRLPILWGHSVIYGEHYIKRILYQSVWSS